MTTLTRRDWLTGMMALSALPRSAIAQDYPVRAVRIIVPYAPGGATDILTRLVAQRLERDLGQPFVVDNRGGGASQVGTQAVATATPDGYTVGLIDSAFTINPGLFGARLPYDTRRDFAPVALLATAPLLFVVHPSVPATNVRELIALAKARPGMTYALPGLGTPVHLAGEQLRQTAGIEIVSVPYRGAGPSIADFIAGNVQMTFATVPSIIDHVRGGRARALAIIGERSTLLPEVPTMAEAGLAGVDAGLMFGMVAPRWTPEAIVARLAQAAERAVTTAPLQARLVEMGYTPLGNGPEAFRERIEADIAKWARVIAAGNIKPE